MDITNRGLATKFKILHAIDRPIDKLPVTELCDRAQLSRHTFYSYFSSKYDVAYWYLEYSEDLFLSDFTTLDEWTQGIKEQIEFLYQEKQVLPHAFSENPHDIEILPRFDSSIARLLERIASTGVEIDDRTRRCASFYISSNRDMIITWCLDGMALSPDLFAQTCCDCIPQQLAGILDIH